MLAANQSLARIFGYELSEMIGLNFLDVLPTTKSRDDIIRHMRTGSFERYEVSGHRKDGSPVVVEITGRSMMFGGKRVLRVLCGSISCGCCCSYQQRQHYPSSNHSVSSTVVPFWRK